MVQASIQMTDLQAAPGDLFFRGSTGDPRLGERACFSLPAGSAATRFRTCVLVGAADDRGVVNGGGRPGARLGPHELRRWLYKLTPGAEGELDPITLVDVGDAAPGPGDARSIEDVHALAGRAVRHAVEAGACALLVGGGHDTAFGSHCGLFDALPPFAKVAALNVDAHLDVRGLRDGLITSGTPFRRLAERFGARYGLCEFGIQPQHNAADHLAFARSLGFSVLTLAELRRGSSVVERFSQELLKAASTGDAVVVSLCLDAVEAASAPGVSAPCPDGFTPSEFYAFARAAGREPKVRLLELVELSPPLDEGGRTARLAAATAWSFLAGLGERAA